MKDVNLCLTVRLNCDVRTMHIKVYGIINTYSVVQIVAEFRSCVVDVLGALSLRVS